MIRIERHTHLPSGLADQAVALTAEVFPGVPELDGRYYYDSEPDLVWTARDGDLLIGFRPMVLRTLELDGASFLMAGGIIPTVRPTHRGRGHARSIVEAALADFERVGVDLSLAFLFDGAPHAFLPPFGYARLRVDFTYEDDTGAHIPELQPAWARGPEWLARVEAAGALHVGRGAF